MKRFPKILAATCAAVALSSSLALAAEPEKAPAAPMAPMGHMGKMAAAGGVHGQGVMGLAALSPEKQELAKAIMNEHREAMFPLHQNIYAKNAELEALNAAGEGESGKAKAVIRDIADLNAKMLMESGRFRTRMVKETGLRTPAMGHGAMMGGHMGGMSGGMMGGKGCPMMDKMAGMQHGAPADAAAQAPAKAPVKGAKAAKAPAHDAHQN